MRFSFIGFLNILTYYNVNGFNRLLYPLIKFSHFVSFNLLNKNDPINFLRLNHNEFNRHNINDLFNNIDKEKITNIYIDKNYQEVITISKDLDIYNSILSDDYDSIDQVDSSHGSIYEQFHRIEINPLLIPKLIDDAIKHHININFIDLNMNELLSNIVYLGNFILPIIIIGSVLRSTSTMTNKITNPMGNKFLSVTKPNITLNQWAGSEEIIDECKDIIDYKKNKEIYNSFNASLPKGILLEGPPGTGKTMLAKIIATELKGYFIPTSGSEFVEMFVGMGANKVRELFKIARQNTPCVIFIDEIDAIGKKRSSVLNMNDEREQTLNQLLYEMDGFNNNDDILVLAATNRKDTLDDALLRPGRFDKIVPIPLPDTFSRHKILELYTKDKKIDSDIDLLSFADLTEGYSGADIKNLINEAIIHTIKNNQTIINFNNLLYAFEKSIVGIIKKNDKRLLNTLMRISIHEAGHALLTLRFDNYFDFQKVSIQATYSGAGGYTLFTENKNNTNDGLYSKDFFMKRLIVALGGKAAENIYYGSELVSLGATQDLKEANDLASQMIDKFGMGSKLEVFYNDNNNKVYSQSTQTLIDEETLKLVNIAYEEAKKILNNNKEFLISFAEILLNKTILYKKDIDFI